MKDFGNSDTCKCMYFPFSNSRFYNALYRKLMSDDLFSTAHCLQFVNLIFKAMKKDSSFKRVLGFTKRLLQVNNNEFLP